MPNYKYTAYGKDGKEIKGSVEAEDKEAALQQIKNAGNIPVNVSEEGILIKILISRLVVIKYQQEI